MNEARGEGGMFSSRIKRPVAGTVLVTFLAMILQPLSAIAQDRPKPQSQTMAPWALRLSAPSLRPPWAQAEQRAVAAQPESGDERYARILNEIHDILKEVAPQAAMPHMSRAKTEVRAVGRDVNIEVERLRPAPAVDLAAKVAQLRAKQQELDALEKHVRASFAETAKHIREKELPKEIATRHDAAVRAYEQRGEEFRRLLDAVERTANGGGEPLQSALNDLGALMAKHPNQKRHGPADPRNLPFGAPKPAPRDPYTTPSEFRRSSLLGERIRVAQAGSVSGIGLPNTTLPPTPTSADTGPTQDVQITQPIRDLAQSLGNNPVQIYNWVRNNIDFVPTYGSIQGSDFTLQARRGNAFDTASLLIALLRAAGTPARYVYGTVEMPADKVMNWVGGMTAAHAALDLMWQGGIPSLGVSQSGVVRWIRLEHVWVEAFVDYIPSRGAVNIVGDTWVPLDASFKQYSRVASLLPPDLGTEMQSVAEAFYASASRSADGASSTGYNEALLQPAFEAMQARFAALTQAHTDKATAEEFLGGRIIAEADPTILAGTLPYKIVATGAHMTELPTTLRLAAQIDVYAVDAYGIPDESTPLLTTFIPLPLLQYKSLNLTHAPATAQDAATWASYTSSGATSFPAYLVNVKPRLSIDGVMLAEGPAVGVGRDLKLKVSFRGAGQSKSAGFDIVAGDEIEVGINGNGHSPLQGFALGSRNDLGTAAGNLFVTAKVYWTLQDFHERLLGALHGVATVRLPSVGIFATPISITYSFGVPRNASYHSRQVDIKLMQTGAAALDGNSRATTTFVLHAGMMGSSTEGSVIEEVFSKRIGQGSNTTRLLQLANEQGIPIYHLRTDNLPTYRAALDHAPEVMADIDNAVNAGLEVIVPQRRQVNGTWNGSGYIMIDPLTAAADYRVSGGLSGNFSGEACERQTEPIKIALPSFSIIWLLLFGWMVDEDFNFNAAAAAVAVLAVIAAIAIVAIVIRSGALVVAGAALAVLTRAAIRLLLLRIGQTALASEDDECACPAKKIARKGGNRVHNACADLFTDPEFEGGDVKVGEKAFDGLRRAEFPPNGTLYEIKTGLFYNTIKTLSLTRPKLQGFLDALKARALAEFQDDRIQASICQYEFRFGSRDQALVGDMQQFFNEAGMSGEALRVFNSGCPAP